MHFVRLVLHRVDADDQFSVLVVLVHLPQTLHGQLMMIDSSFTSRASSRAVSSGLPMPKSSKFFSGGEDEIRHIIQRAGPAGGCPPDPAGG